MRIFSIKRKDIYEMADLKIVEKPEEKAEDLKWKVNEAVMTELIDRMNRDKVIAKPEMKFIFDDKGIVETLFNAHMREEQVEILKQAKPDTFLMVMAVHGMGAGMMTIYKQKQKGKTLGHFSEDEVNELNDLFKAYDAYQLACETTGAKPGTELKKYLDSVASQSVYIAKQTAEDRLFKDEVLKGFVQTMFNLGVTIAVG